MFTIKIGKIKIKLLNWVIFISTIILIIYLFGSFIYMLPLFSKNFEYSIKKENYSIMSKVKFKNSWSNCKISEEFNLIVKDKTIKSMLERDLLNDGFKGKNGKYLRILKKTGACNKIIKSYKKTHSNNYVIFNLKGKKNEIIDYENDYLDPYVTLKVNGKDKNNIEINSNFNKNKIGNYIITYTANISDDYKQMLYRKISVVDRKKPVLILNGDKEISLDYGSKYEEQGFTATDNYDGNLTNKVEVKNTVNTKKSGTYIITYKVKDSSNNITSEKRTVIVKEKSISTLNENKKIEAIDGITYVNGILIVNKTYGLPKNYDPKVNKEALKALENMQADAKVLGLKLPLVSGYRSYGTQENLYNKYVKKDGENKANTYSAKPGHSEHQTGLAFDVGSILGSFANTDEAKWLEENCHLYGFIIRYPKGKTNITGYIYEPWHIRYLGKEIAKKVKESGLTLEEYLGL